MGTFCIHHGTHHCTFCDRASKAPERITVVFNPHTGSVFAYAIDAEPILDDHGSDARAIEYVLAPTVKEKREPIYWVLKEGDLYVEDPERRTEFRYLALRFRTKIEALDYVDDVTGGDLTRPVPVYRKAPR
jgi:hypothetical protein